MGGQMTRTRTEDLWTATCFVVCKRYVSEAVGKARAVQELLLDDREAALRYRLHMAEISRMGENGEAGTDKGRTSSLLGFLLRVPHMNGDRFRYSFDSAAESKASICSRILLKLRSRWRYGREANWALAGFRGQNQVPDGPIPCHRRMEYVGR